MKKEEKEIINKQFEIIGEKMRVEDIPEDGMLEVKRKGKDVKECWWNIYKFKNYEQYMEWKEWALERISEKEFDILDMLYGFNFPLEEQKEGQMAMF